MSTTLKSLETRVRPRIGDRDPNAYRWNPEEVLNLIEDAVAEYNAEAPAQEYEVTGSGDSRAINPAPVANNLRLIMLYTELLAAESDRKSNNPVAVKRTSPLGSFDGTKINESWAFEIRRIRREIDNHKRIEGNKAAADGMEARGISISEPGHFTT